MKRILSAIILAILSLKVQSATEEVNGIIWTYQIVDGTASVGGGVSGSTAVPSSTSGELTIPSTLGGLTVTRIGDYAFEKCYSVRKIIVPESVIEVGCYAFTKCWALPSIELPDSVTRLGAYAFDSAALSSFSIPSGITKIEDGTFDGTNLKSITIPEGVKSIGNWAFYNCYDLSTVSIASSVESIGWQAFDNCASLGDGIVIVDGCVLTINGDCPEKLVMPNGTRLVAGGVFWGCKTLVDVVMPEGLVGIGDSAFCNCSAITNLTFPASLTHIGASAFFGCYDLKTVTMRDAVETVGDSAFCSCTSLVSVAMSSKIKRIEANTFNGCKSLVSFDIPEGVGDIGYESFYLCTKLESVSMPGSVTNIEHDAFTGCCGLGNGMVIVNGCVLTVNGSLPATTEISGNVRLIAKGALSGCSSVEQFCVDATNQWFSEFEGSIYNTEMSQLVCCPGSVQTLNVCTGTKELGDYSCYNCQSLTTVLLPQSLERIGDDVFEVCGKLSGIDLPEKVRSVGKNVFASCNSMTTMKVFSLVPPTIEKSALAGARSVKTIYVPYGSLETYKSAEVWSDYATLMIEMKKLGCEENPWRVGDSINAYITDGCLYINGSGNVDASPWMTRTDEITKVNISSNVTGLSSGVLSGMTSLKYVNGLSLNVFNSILGAVSTDLSIAGIDSETQTIRLSVKVMKTESLKDGKWEQALEPTEMTIPVSTPTGFFKLENNWIQ